MEAKAIIGPSRPRIDQTINRQFGIINYDQDNIYPQRMEILKASSGTATRCVNTYARYLKGQGFSDKTFYKAVVNRKKLTVDGLLRKHALDFALQKGIAFHINYNALLEPVEWNYVPWSFLRLGDQDNPGKVALYDDWAKQKRKKILHEHIDYIDLYNPDKETIAAQIEAAGGFDKWKGQILWMSYEHDEYPLSTIDPVIEDVQSDAEAKTFRMRGLTTNFMPSHMLVTDKTEGPTGKEEFRNNLTKFQGAKNSNKILWVEKTSPNQTVALEKFDLQDTDKMFEITTRTCKEGIVENFGIPNIIMNIQTPGKLGNSQELKEASDFYNGLTDDDRQWLSEAYAKAFEMSTMNPSKDYSIIPLTLPFTATSIPKELYPDMSKNERRKLIDFPEELNAQAVKTVLAVTLGVGSTQSMITVITDPTLSPEQKIKTLQIVFSLSEEDATALINPTKHAF